MKNVLLVLALAGASAYGQDPGAWAAQQAMQASQQATQQALQDMQTAQQAAQQANQQAMQAAQQASDAGQANYPYFPFPNNGVLSLSVAPGTVKPGTKVRINFSGPGRDAKVYYTTDGWTPTQASTLYTGPIAIDASTHLEAVALGAGIPRSLLIRADYMVPGAAPQPVPRAPALATNGVLAAGTPIRLATAAEISSATAHAGDKVPLLLDEDVRDGDRVLAAKGAAVDAVLTLAVPAKNGAAGELAFQVRSFQVRSNPIDGLAVPLTGGAMLEGGVAKDAVIEPGKGLTAKVTGETRLNP